MKKPIVAHRNETITDDIVRDFFLQHSDSVIIERQSSQNPIIDKLLKNASKRGFGKGYPDLILQYKKDLDFLIVIENKADKSRHESQSQKEYADYAVDGVLAYASYLSKGFNVLAIAVSGTDKNDLKVSHFLHLKDEPKAFNYFGDVLLSPDDYYDGMNASEEKKRQDYDKLLDYTRVLNTKLHLMHVDEAERCILTSCILLALRLKHFRDYYKTEDNQSILVNRMFNDVMDWFRKENIGYDKIKNIESKYSAIRGKFDHESGENELRALIADIDYNIDAFRRTNRYYDVLGQMFVAFLRYANTSHDLGVVLTPSHITDFFAEVAGVNKDSIVFDNCTGTCGFLIAAMRKMMNDANGDKQSEKSIRSRQLIGVEKGDKMYCLAASNMAIHRDGKTQIRFGDGTDPDLIAEIKSLGDGRPNIGMLNPPYKADKKIDTEELEFVKWNLEALCQKGICVAIVPMQCAIATRGKTARLKKELLEKHTLKAVFSMPDELFYNSNKSVATCVMVFEAHRRHPSDFKTFFGYFKDDGFEKRKKLGRIDVRMKWNSIKDRWLYLYDNNEESVGESVKHHVAWNDEWCAEAYMKTDCSKISEMNFISDLRDYSVFHLNNDSPFIVRGYGTSAVSSEVPDLWAREWKWFDLSKIFSFDKGRRLTKADSIPGEIPLVTTGRHNQGVSRCVDNDMQIFCNCLTIDMFGYCVFRDYEFCCDDNILIFKPKKRISSYAMMFLSTVINLDGYKCAYGRQYRKKTQMGHRIQLPVTENGEPDFELMERYIKALPYSCNIREE